MAHLKETSKPSSLRAFRMGVFTRAKKQGVAPLPWSSPCGGGEHGIAHKSPPYDSIEFLYTVLTCQRSYAVNNQI
eukprot:5758371-Ditylum_brightwellii.AAC.1